MQVSVENTGKLTRLMKIQVPAEQIDSKIASRLKEMSRQVRLKGFRPGRVPMTVVKQRFGKQVRQEIIGQTIQESLGDAFRQEDLHPVGQPRVEPKMESLESGDLEYTAEFEVFPEIGDTDIASLQLSRPVAEVEDSDVETMIETLQQQRAKWDVTEDPAREGDRVTIEYVAAAAGEVRHPAVGRERLMVLPGNGAMPGAFEAALVGQKGGDKVEAEIEFDEDFRVVELAGKKATVDIEIIQVEVATLPDVNEEFIRIFGVESGELDDLKVEIRKNLERELATARTSLLKLEVTNKLLEARSDLEVPQALIEQEATNLQQSDVNRLQQSGIESPQPQPLDFYMDAARKRVAAGLLFSEIARNNKIEIDADRVREAIESIAQTFEQPAQVVELYYSNQNLLDGVQNSVLEEQVVDWVLTEADVSDRQMSFQEVIHQASRGR